MRTSATETQPRRAADVQVTRDSLVVDLTDGRTLKVPLSWYSRLEHGTTSERDTWRLIGSGTGIHWPDLDEDISVDGLLAGLASNETQTSLNKWLASRKPRRG